ncbi:hypothetical protein [Prochlorococcus marinus]|uniref:hypothetical protein n=1 Tax=Prochlorococcus marinus TaxID=1219 RepID=UPI000533B105|nr:hypothetical protein [Prochlorococcus marinus]KGG12796.1 hypothetical protein EV05_0467 [Prochlorococcus sp. MIT 0601]
MIDLLKAIQLNGTNRTTSWVVWSMMIFLGILITGLGIVLFKQIQLKLRAKKHPIKNDFPKGFS